MSARRRGLRWAVIATVPALGVLSLVSPPRAGAASTGPSAVAWFDATAMAGAPPVPQPDVPAGGGLVAGANPTAATTTAPVPVPVTNPDPTGRTTSPQTTAVTTLRFTLPSGVSASKLTLAVAQTGTDAGGVPPLACLTTSGWSAGDQQPGSITPNKDCSISSLSTDDGTTLVFGDIGQLQRGTTLDIEIVPSAAGRTVIMPPSATALSTIGVSPDSAEPVFASPVTATPTTAAPRPIATVASASTAAVPAAGAIPPPGAAAPAPAAAAGVPAAAVPPAADVALPAAGADTSAAVAPPAADTTTPTGVGAQTAAPAAAVTPLSAHRTALLVALVLLLALAGLFYGLDPDGRNGRLAAAVGTLRGKPVSAPPTGERGVGRFRHQRAGSTPEL